MLEPDPDLVPRLTREQLLEFLDELIATLRRHRIRLVVKS